MLGFHYPGAKISSAGLNNSVLWGPLALCNDDCSFSCVRDADGRTAPAVNVTVIPFALIMKQRKPCRALGFVNGPTDGFGFHLVCARAESASLSSPRDQR